MNFIATVKKGELKINDEVAYGAFLSGLEDKKLLISIDKYKDKRTLSQNAYYWLYLGMIEKETGNNANDMHELFKRMFLPPVYKVVLNKRIKLPKSTTKLSTVEFGEYLEKICAETKYPLPPIEL